MMAPSTSRRSVRRNSIETIFTLTDAPAPPYALEDLDAAYGDETNAASRTQRDLPAAESSSGLPEAVESALLSVRVLTRVALDVPHSAYAGGSAIRQDGDSISKTLTSLQESLLNCSLSPSMASSLIGTLKNCLLTANQLRDMLEPYTESKQGRSRSAWRSLKRSLSKQEIKDLRERLQRLQSNLTRSLKSINSEEGPSSPEPSQESAIISRTESLTLSDSTEIEESQDALHDRLGPDFGHSLNSTGRAFGSLSVTSSDSASGVRTANTDASVEYMANQ